MSAMRIAHIGPASLPVGYKFGGAVERRMIELAAAQVARGDEVLLVSMSPDGPREPGAAKGVSIHDVPCRTRRPIRDLELLARARGALRRFAPDVVHVHNSAAGAAMLAGIPAAKVLTFDYFQYRGTARPAVKAAYRRALQQFDLLLPVSEFCAREAATWWNLPRNAFTVLPNGVNVEQFRPDEERRAAVRRKYDIDDDVVIGYVGRVCEQKGSDTLVEAFRSVKGRFARSTLLMAGPSDWFGTAGPDPTPLTDEIGRVGGRWLGPVPEDELADVFRSLDVCAMPTRQDEMFGMAAAEALSSGTPVVCSDQGGLPEVVPSTAGVLVPPGDAEELARVLLALCEDAESRARFAAAAPEAARKFTWPAVADQADRIYREVARR
ncbi:glycosyltransferase family 4 protein [Pseudonocardia sp. TRM90224]|uniref:glycosyltransferase family 4 protein n=1 Tax=Pseudonocardia sp. TRM90224 TaxID=2812678 RepID=UPI001E494529|nr:glycosyltransferase family 4 protein [Pseudonocardia sp. TRM90224]